MHTPDDELARHHRPMAETPAAGQSPPPLGNHPGAGGAEHGLRGRAGESANPPRDTRPERATRFIETARGVLSYSQLAPLLAERVVAVQADIERGVYSQRPFEESLLIEFHRRIAGDLVPEWAGRWRAIEVRVGNLLPPPPHAVPARMRDYCLDLQVRWAEAAASIGDLTLEFLAFAEGRFLTVHPFQDFNGRVVRLFLSELLRRFDLPPVRLEAEGESERAAYFVALEAADRNDLSPLIEIWKQRLAASESPTA
jgi:CRISPR-associated endonuclease/helicase Cas3